MTIFTQAEVTECAMTKSIDRRDYATKIGRRAFNRAFEAASDLAPLDQLQKAYEVGMAEQTAFEKAVDRFAYKFSMAS